MGGAESAHDTVIERMGAGDVDAVAAVEARAYDCPWGREALAAELGRDFARVDVVRERSAGGERVVAFCDYWLVADEVHLLSIATDPSRRGRGYARRLLDHLIAEGERAGCIRVTLEVRRSNARAIDLYRRLGFQPVGARRAYYADGEDAIVMLRPLQAAGNVS